MRVFVALIVGLLIGYAAHWYVVHRDTEVHVVSQTHDHGTTSTTSSNDLFDTEKIKKELARTGQVIREKAHEAGQVISDAAANARITGAIKAKLLSDSTTDGMSIDVDTTDGVVTLSGKVSSHEQIARAMSLAMETEGVQKVVSTLQVKQGATQ